MPVKTDEVTRLKVVELFKAGKSYKDVTKETGLTKPVVWKIKKEAGLPIKPRNVKKTESTQAISQVGGTGTVRPASGDGVMQFQPVVREPAKKVKAEVVQPGEKVHIQCDKCGVILQGDPGDEMPETCPECGE